MTNFRVVVIIKDNKSHIVDTVNCLIEFTEEYFLAGELNKEHIDIKQTDIKTIIIRPI